MSFAQPYDPALIANHVQKCLDSFRDACSKLAKAGPLVRGKIPPGAMHDCFGRFRLWVGNIGAHRRGRASLDYKLREASHIRIRVLELLQNLESDLQEAQDIITGQHVPWEDMSDSDSDASDDNEPEQPGSELHTELAQLVSNMAEINGCLMRLSLAIRNPAPHDQFKESTQIDVAHFEVFDIDHVRGKFPRAAEFLVLRLGKAISRRRQYLRYREEHRRKLEQGLKSESGIQEPVVSSQAVDTITAPSEKIESTVASSLPLAIKTSASMADLDEDDYYEDTLSQTSYASSHSDLTRLRPPALPEAGQDGEPFECPLCFRFTSVRQAAAWHKHVYRDLQPYVCTFDDCKIPDRTYESRHEWFQHELQAHRKWWECIEGCNDIFRSLHAFHEHLAKEHEVIVDNDRTADLVRNCERQESMTTEADCKLCDMKLPALTQLRRHVGKHHEELSLFALPSHMNEDDDEHDEGHLENKSVSSVAGSDGSSPEQVTCDDCGLSFGNDSEDRLAALFSHIANVHGLQNMRISNIEETDPRIDEAKDLLRRQPSVEQVMDEQMIDKDLINRYLRRYLPVRVDTWMRFKDWFGEYTSDLDHEQIPVLQAIQFQTMANTQEFAPTNDSPIDDETSTMDTTLRTPWPTFEDTVPVKDIVPIDGVQESWQCTFCLERLTPKSWRRHEETQHRSKHQWTCLATGPRTHIQADNSSMCVFCQLENPSEDHLMSSHRIQECLKKPEAERRFNRPDHLRQHVKNFHRSSLLDIVRDKWRRAAPTGTGPWTCGFCNEELTTWDIRERHIANHFKDGLTMASWRNLPATGDLSSSEQVHVPILVRENTLPPLSIQDTMAAGLPAIAGIPERQAQRPPPKDIKSGSSVPTALANDMIACPRCTLENRPSLTTCEVCGAPLATAQSSSSNFRVGQTKAQFDGVPNLSPETWATVEISYPAMFFWELTEDGLTKTRWHIAWEFLQDFSLHDNHVHMKGLLYHDDQSDSRDFTMSFEDKDEAGSIYARIARAIERNTARLEDAQSNPRQVSDGIDQTSREGSNCILQVQAQPTKESHPSDPWPAPNEPSLQVPAAGRRSFPYASASTAPDLESRAESNVHSLSVDTGNALVQRPLPQTFYEVTRSISPAATPQHSHFPQNNSLLAPYSYISQTVDELAPLSRQISLGVPEVNIDFAPSSRQTDFELPSPPEIDIEFTPPWRNRSRSPTLSQASRAPTLRPASFEPPPGPDKDQRIKPRPATFPCTLCPKRFTRANNLRSHLRRHTDERPFICSICGKAFARQHDRKRHEGLHPGEKKFVCRGTLADGSLWGCGRRFAQADALSRHFRSEAGRVCIRPLLEKEAQDQGSSKDPSSYRNMLLELAKPRDNDNEDEVLRLDEHDAADEEEYYEADEEDYDRSHYFDDFMSADEVPTDEMSINMKKSPLLQRSKQPLDLLPAPQPEPK